MSVLTLNVDEVMRTLSAESANPFVTHDKEVDIVRFAINSGFADIVLDGQVALRVMYQRPGESEVREQTLTYYDTDGLHNYYDWQLSQSDLAKNGSLMVALCILRTNGDVEEWHTTPCQIRVLDTIHTDDSDEGDETITPTVAQRVAVLETMIQRIASGAPIVVSSVSAMTDTEQIYVLSTDGKWYYYDGSAWMAGGEYGGVAAGSITTDKLANKSVTTAKLADGAVTEEKLASDLKSDLINKPIHSSEIDINHTNYSSYFTDANDAPLNKIYHFVNTITSNMVSHLPVYGIQGTLLTTSYLPTAVNTKLQLFWDGYNRIYYRSKTNGTWSNWESVASVASVKDDVVGAVFDAASQETVKLTNDANLTNTGFKYIDEFGNLTTYTYNCWLSDFISINANSVYKITVRYDDENLDVRESNLRIHLYTADKGWLKQEKVVKVSPSLGTVITSICISERDARYLRFSVPVKISQLASPITSIELYAANTIYTNNQSEILRLGLHTVPKSDGALNAIKRARQLTDCMWTPVADLPRSMLNTGDTYLNSHGNSYQGRFAEGKEYQGMPYSYTRGTPRYVGINVPIDTFYSCLTNPQSVLYRESRYSGNTSVYYGATCSTVVGYALQLPNIDSNYHSRIKGMKRLYPLIENGIRNDLSDLEIGDVLIETTHVALIGDIIRTNGVVTDIEILEETRQGCTDKTVLDSKIGGVARRFWMTVDEFFTWFDGFSLYRYTNIDSVKFTRNPYTPLHFGEKSAPISYFPCMPYYGNRKVFSSAENGNEIEILIHDTSYTHLVVYRNGLEYNSYEITGLTSATVMCEYGEAEYSANLVTYSAGGSIESISVTCYWYTMPDYDFTIADDDTNHNITVTVRKGEFKPWYVTFNTNATENNPDGFTLVDSIYDEIDRGENVTYTFSVPISASDSHTCIFALYSDKYAYFKLRKTY